MQRIGEVASVSGGWALGLAGGAADICDSDRSHSLDSWPAAITG